MHQKYKSDVWYSRRHAGADPEITDSYKILRNLPFIFPCDKLILPNLTRFKTEVPCEIRDYDCSNLTITRGLFFCGLFFISNKHMPCICTSKLKHFQMTRKKEQGPA